jgi:tetratricopeptide (TPR) repeat protein
MKSNDFGLQGVLFLVLTLGTWCLAFAQDTQQQALYYVNQGRDLEKKGLLDDAIADENKALELDPNNALAYFYLGYAKDLQGNMEGGTKDLDGAIVLYSKSIQLDSNYPPAYVNRGSDKLEKEDYDGAIADETKAIELDPNNGSAYMDRGSAETEKGDYKGAKADAIALKNIQAHKSGSVISTK